MRPAPDCCNRDCGTGNRKGRIVAAHKSLPHPFRRAWESGGDRRSATSK
jgi:hypothetical protein